MYSTIKAKVVDQTLTITSVGKLASGGENEIRVEVSFDSYWAGYGKTAIFYREEKQVYHVVMVSDACVIPREVLAVPGRLYFGILGTSGSSVRTTEVVALNVAQGAITGLGKLEPLPDVYKQVLAAAGKNEQAIAVERARLDNLVAGETTDGELIDIRVGADGTTYASAGSAVRAQITSLVSGVGLDDAVIDARQTQFATVNPNNLFNADKAKVITGYYGGDGNLVVTELFKTVFFRVQPNTLYYTNFAPTQSLNLTYFDATGGIVQHLGTGSYASGTLPACADSRVALAAMAVYAETDVASLVISTLPIDKSADNSYYYELPHLRIIPANLSSMPDSPASGKVMLVFGDSITETATVSDDGATYTEGTRVNWPKYAKTILGLGEMWNFAKSGAHYKDDAGLSHRQWISNQITAAIDTGKNADIIVLSAGTNDENGNYGSYEAAMAKTTLDSLDRENLYDAIRWAMWTLRKSYPTAVCFVTTPIQRADHDVAETIRAAILDMAGRYNFIVIDAERESGIVKENEVWGAEGVYLVDGLHPNEAGSKRLAALYSSVIKRYCE